jgi:cell division protein FtsW
MPRGAAAGGGRRGSGHGSASGRSTGTRSSGGRSSPTRSRPTGRRVPPPLEHRILMTATLCLLAFGAVMVYSASSPLGVLGARGGNGTGEFVRYVVFGGIGLAMMHVLGRRGLTILDRRVVRVLLITSFVLLVLVLAPGLGVRINGAKRWFAAGPIQFQPSELMKLALVLYVARYLADHPRRMRGFKRAVAPIAVIAAPACLLIVVEPDLGTTLVVAFSITALLIAGGMPLRYLAMIAGIAAVLAVLMIIAQPYQRARLTSFLDPWAAKSSAGFQAVQGQIALGSGGLFGVGLGRSVQKVFYLPEAQTDFILAVIGEELGVLGIFGVIFLYGMIAYAGLRTARRAADRYAKLLATGLTSLILCQGTLNIFVVLGLAPLTGVPLPFISYAPTNLCVMLVAVGLLLNISRPGARRLRVVDGSSARRPARRDGAADRDRRRRDRGARRAGAGGRGRAAS